MSNDKEKPEYWTLELEMDHADRLYAVRRISREKEYAYNPVFFVKVEAQDEIGAFNAAQKILTGLGFRNGLLGV